MGCRRSSAHRYPTPTAAAGAEECCRQQKQCRTTTSTTTTTTTTPTTPTTTPTPTAATSDPVPLTSLLWIKLINFTGVLGNVAWGRYQIMYLNAQGQSPMGNGMLRASGLLAKFFATPIWGAMGDRYPPAQPLMVSVLLCVVMLDAYRWKSVSTSFWALLFLKIGRSACNGVGTLTDIITLR